MKETILGSIDAAGRLVVPTPIRDAAGLRPDVVLEIRLRDGRVEIEPAPVDVRIEMHGGVAVATPAGPVPSVTGEEVEIVRRRIREEREDPLR